jgi:UDP-sulfoquinovose synthase
LQPLRFGTIGVDIWDRPAAFQHRSAIIDGNNPQETTLRIVVLGGDGFCGWPTTLHLSRLGHDLVIVDNLSRRTIDHELGIQSLTPISSLQERLDAWNEVAERHIGHHIFTVGENYRELLDLFIDFRADAVIHFAEQRAAPYSMKSSAHRRYTVRNNLTATNDVLAAIVESRRDIHLIHLGSMGVYGYGFAGTEIPEGYLTIRVEGQHGFVEREVLYPANPGSIYHLTKAQDQLLFQFYNKNDDLRITDLHQGIVWGTQTEETKLDERLINRFDYDGDYGTVLNRFLMQAALDYPLSVHGSGGQTRAFINIQDTVRCIELALNNPPKQGERVKVLNQMTETHRVRDLAKLVSRLCGSDMLFLRNPRKEAAENELPAVQPRLLTLGLEPIRLQDALLLEIRDIALRYRGRIDKSKIPCLSYWSRELEPNG